MTIYNNSKFRVGCSFLYLVIPFVCGLCILPEQPIFGGLFLALFGFSLYSSIKHRKDCLILDEEKITIFYGNTIKEFR